MNLIQTYPNPFNSTVEIEVTLARTQSAKITVHDLYGRQVSVLHEGIMPAGANLITLDGDQLSAGTYMIMLSTADMSQSHAVTLLK